MARYEPLKTITLASGNVYLRSRQLPELVHLNDPAFMVMTDFSQTPPHVVHPDKPIDDALNEMKIHGVHLLLVQDDNKHIIGVVGSEEILGELPIKISQEKRIKRSQVLVKMVMTPLDQICAFDMHTLEYAKVGNIIITLKSLRTHYALIINNENDSRQVLRGIFTTSQISRQLHMDISDAIAKAQSISELQKRQSKI
ncbi:CBS domain-containing protein [Coxiella burnetii]|uniref:CBS domain-containing protein n=1 Tax=Coxiella burnetii TaxID=777 RepID=UPI000163A3A0|nr:CBS domain-containing protein [Coxiella burnetii]ATN85299.1 hypothetical protein AYO29_01685 [Coxiella burnetii str. Schperling]EDR36612.1 CBS domain protein [Coxiella burnetii Q321]PHH57476.1 CBS domain-containing protein [Coxiella burnetii]